jgi:hypothetical protein
MQKFNLTENLEDLEIKAIIENEVYEDGIKILSQIPLEGDREKYINIVKDKHGITKEAIRNDIQHSLKTNHKNEIKEDNEELPPVVVQPIIRVFDSTIFCKTCKLIGR